MKRALFLDRDGIINVDHGYVHNIQKFTFNEKIFELLRLFQSREYLLFIVTNQSGIGRGYYSLEEFQRLTQWMLDRLKEEGITIESVKFCPHAPELNCTCRKPATGMIDDILKEYRIDLARSWMIGDKQSDIDLAHRAQIANTIAIGPRNIEHATYRFKTIERCYDHLKVKLTQEED